MTRRQFRREFKREVVHLVVDLGVSVAQAARDLDLHQTVLRRWIQQYRDQAEEAFPGQGKLTPADDEVRQLKREVARLKAERDILKKPRPTSRGTRCNVRVHREAPGDMAGQLDVWGARCLSKWLPCLADPTAQCASHER
ncbi:MAG: transposase [Maricaulis sp.]|nr:transposase [Maricaulis sp.]